ncbi:MAG: DUF1501 domain-containing protein [Armatimonadota bacterium]
MPGCGESPFQHPRMTRRASVQAGAVGLLGLGLNHLAALRALAAEETDAPAQPRARSVIFIFLSGGLSQFESFDMKPDAPAEIRGEFRPIPTRTDGIRICEHLPLLAQRSPRWALVRSLTHAYNEHSQGHHVMLTGRTELPPGFDPSRPKHTDWPSLAAVAGAVLPQRHNLPPAVVLPEKLVHSTGRVIPGQFAGMMGAPRDPWFIEAAPFDARAYGAYPEYEFDHQQRPRPEKEKLFQAPSLSLPPGIGTGRMQARVELLRQVDRQRADLERLAEVESFDRYRQDAVSLLTAGEVRSAVDVTRADPRTLERYGRNSFGWSLLMARRLVEVGVGLVQVNLGNNETWDTHGNAFPHLKEKLLPPTDRAVSALLDDLHDSGLLESTLIVMAGEFGRTPQISHLAQHYKLPGRDHWGAAQSVWFAGGGVRGGTVIGSTTPDGGLPASDPQTPESFAATIYQALGIPRLAEWRDAQGRPHAVYHGEPIPGLVG